jgi:hypothetical protein
LLYQLSYLGAPRPALIGEVQGAVQPSVTARVPYSNAPSPRIDFA